MMLDAVVNFINNDFVVLIISYVQTVITLFTYFFTALAVFSHLVKPMWRFGYARWRKPICILASNDRFGPLKRDLVDAGIIKEKNIEQIDDEHLGSIKEAWTIVLCFDVNNDADIIDKEREEQKILNALNNKRASCPAFIYAPGASLNRDTYREVNTYENVTVCNLRGRLINDLTLSLLTTSFRKK